VAVSCRLQGNRTLAGSALCASEVAVEDPYAGLSDSDLADRFDRGEGEALNALCRRHYRSVFRFAYSLTQNLPEAEDCTQEAFARFIRSWSRWVDRSRGAGPWLATIVRNVVVDHWQKQLKGAKVNDPLLADAGGKAGVGHSPDSDTLERELLGAIEQALQAMEPPCRELIELLFRKGLTQKEAAETLGASHEAVKKRYQRCLKRLQADLGEWGVP
jgi:RNA polymerase sigma-70 factor (ECF subfamily)